MAGNNQHTPGPWEVIKEGFRCYFIGKDEYEITVVNDEADARLIAAAPELLAACKKMVEVYEEVRYSGMEAILDERDLCATIKQMNDAIRKAEAGEIKEQLDWGD